MKQKEIKALMVAPKEYPKVVTLKTDLDSLQKAVSIGASYQCTTIICSVLQYSAVYYNNFSGILCLGNESVIMKMRNFCV